MHSHDKLLSELNQLRPLLGNYQPYYAVKADFLKQLGQIKPARKYYKKAIEITGNKAVKDFLVKKVSKLSVVN